MEQRNLLLAIVLSVGILIGFQFVFQRLHPPVPHTGTEATSPDRPVDASAARTRHARHGRTGRPRQRKRSKPCRRRSPAKPRVDINTPRLHGSIALIGAKFDDLTLANYHETVDPKSPEVVLLSPTGTEDPYFAEFGWVPAEAGTVKVPGPDTQWTASGGPLTPTNPVTLTWDNGEGLVFTRTISVDENYMFTVHDAVHNTGPRRSACCPMA